MDWTPRPAFDCSFLMLVKVNVYCRQSMKPKLMIFDLIIFYLDAPCHFCQTRVGFLEVTTLASFFIHPLLGNPQAGSFFELIFQTRKNVNTLYVSSEKQKLWLVNEGCLQNKPCIVYTDHSFNTLPWKAALVCFKPKCKHSFASSFPLMPKSVCLCVFYLCIFMCLCVFVGLCSCLCAFVFVT